MLHPHEKVGNAPHPSVQKRHLIDHIVAGVERITDSVDPFRERLTFAAARDLIDVNAVIAVLSQTVRLMLETFVHQEARKRSESIRVNGEGSGIDPVPQGEKVIAVEPGADLGGSEQLFSHRQMGSARR
jgi:hypothetical protein